MRSFFKLIRYQNLILLALMQFIFRYGFLKLQNVGLALADFQYALLVLATVLIAAAGYVINNIFDQNTDLENKPNTVVVGKTISEKNAYTIYVVLNIIGVAIGFYLSNVIQKPGFASIFILVASLLYFYATSLKQMLLVGNILVAALLSFSIIIVGFFDLYPAIYPGNQQEMSTLFSLLLDYAVMAFIINFIRELVKDLEDMNGDYNQGMSTLPIVLGRSRTVKVVFALSFIPIVLLLKYTLVYYFANNLFVATIYFLIFIIAPLIYFTIKTYDAKTVQEFKHLSTILKLVIFFGIISIAVVSLNILYNA